MARGKWWEIYNDPELNALEEQVSISNQNLKAAEAQFREAKFAVQDRPLQPVPHGFRRSLHRERTIVDHRDCRNQLCPVTPPTTCRWTCPTKPIFGEASGASIQASAEAAQVSAAQLENARLSYQAELAQDYFELRGTDGEKELLETTVNPIRITSSSPKTGLIMVWRRVRTSLRRRPNWKPRGPS